jgi:hypothetical protein
MAETVAPVAADPETGTAPTETTAPLDRTSAPADTPPTDAEPPVGEGLDAPVEGEAVPPADAGAEAPPAEPADLTAALEAGYYDPFTFRVDGQLATYDGAVQDDDGNVLFTPQAVRQLQRDLAFARDYPTRTRESGRALAAEKAGREAAEATTKKVLDKLDELFESSQGATTVEELLETPLGKWMLTRHAEWPKLRTQGLQAGFDRRTKAQDEELQRLRQAETDRREQPVMVGRVEEVVQHWAEEAGIDDAAVRGLIRQFTTPEMLDLVFPRAREDDPATGMKAGQRTENLEVIRREMLFLHNLLKGRTGKGAADVKAENDRRTGKTGSEAPPIAGGKRGTAPPSGKEKTKFRSTKEADEAIWNE